MAVDPEETVRSATAEPYQPVQADYGARSSSAMPNAICWSAIAVNSS